MVKNRVQKGREEKEWEERKVEWTWGREGREGREEKREGGERGEGWVYFLRGRIKKGN